MSRGAQAAGGRRGGGYRLWHGSAIPRARRRPLHGTCSSIESALDCFELGADPAQVERQLLDEDLERCEGCGRWMEPGELVDDDEGAVVGCDSCRDPDD